MLTDFRADSGSGAQTQDGSAEASGLGAHLFSHPLDLLGVVGFRHEQLGSTRAPEVSEVVLDASLDRAQRRSTPVGVGGDGAARMGLAQPVAPSTRTSSLSGMLKRPLVSLVEFYGWASGA